MVNGTGALVAQGQHAGGNRRSLHGRKAAKDRLGEDRKYNEMSHCDGYRQGLASFDGETRSASCRELGMPVVRGLASPDTG
jgi:hypothetical protein